MMYDNEVSKVVGRKKAKMIPCFLAWSIRVIMVPLSEGSGIMSSLMGNWGRVSMMLRSVLYMW